MVWYYVKKMHSFIVVSKDKKTRDDYTLTLCKEKRIHTIDISIIEEEGSIGIAIVRDLQKTFFLKPLKSKTKACVIQNAEKLTIEAQNALLKLLEEPPDNTIIILSAEDTNAFLPTVLSRCNVIQLSSSQNIKPLTLPHESIGQRLKLAQDLAKNKDEAITWLENAILSMRQEIINEKGQIQAIKSLQETYVILKTTNTNTRLTLENLFLNI